MKRYVYSASLHELKSSLYGILGLFDDIEKIDLKPMGDNATKVIIQFSDGKQAEMTARYGSRDRQRMFHQTGIRVIMLLMMVQCTIVIINLLDM